MCLSCLYHPLTTFFVTFFFFKQKPAYHLRISDWSSDVCSSDRAGEPFGALRVGDDQRRLAVRDSRRQLGALPPAVEQGGAAPRHHDAEIGDAPGVGVAHRQRDAVAALDAVPLDQPRRDLARGGKVRRETQTLVTPHHKGQGPTYGPKKGEKGRQVRR